MAEAETVVREMLINTSVGHVSKKRVAFFRHVGCLWSYFLGRLPPQYHSESIPVTSLFKWDIVAARCAIRILIHDGVDVIDMKHPSHVLVHFFVGQH